MFDAFKRHGRSEHVARGLSTTLDALAERLGTDVT